MSTDNIQEFAHSLEHCTATMTMPMDSGEHYGPPLSVGYYDGNNTEIWIEGEGGRISIQLTHLKPFIKQLRRAADMAAEEKVE